VPIDSELSEKRNCSARHRPASPDGHGHGHGHGVDAQFSAQVIGHQPAYDFPCRHILDGRQIQPAFARWNIRNIRQPDVIGRSWRVPELVYERPVSGNVPWADIEALFKELGGKVSEREGSRVGVVLFGAVRAFQRPHPKPDTDKGVVASVRKWLEAKGVTS